MTTWPSACATGRCRSPTSSTAIDRAAGILGLGELMRRKPRELSGGQQQRVALGRCIVRNPKVFLFDEPLSNLDAKLRAQMRLEIKRLRARVPTTSVFVTHDQVEAMTLGRPGGGDEGRLHPAMRHAAAGLRRAGQQVRGRLHRRPVDELRRRDDSRARRRTCSRRTPSARVRLPAERRHALSAWKDRSVILGVRPEHLAVGAPGGEPLGSAVVEVIEQLGSEIVLEARAGDCMMTVARVDPQSALAAGDTIELSAQPDQLHFFDPESELAIR